jgi:pyruvate kinase
VDPHLAELTDGLDRLQAALSAAEAPWSSWLAPSNRGSVRTRSTWCSTGALRQQDLRTLQMGLARLGLSSLGRSEPHVQETSGPA